ncbi:hypothetical protein GCM10010261_61910 [Streptomyces pilosus]|nr:hypothetical protein GCM10010261_61910 [Streptomyces pilosus]
MRQAADDTVRPGRRRARPPPDAGRPAPARPARLARAARHHPGGTTYRPIFTPGRSGAPTDISVDVPLLRLLRTATLTPVQQRLMDLLRRLLDES